VSDRPLVERRIVSRKTPGDGRLEITAHAAERIARMRPPLRLELDGRPIPAELGTLPCTCRGAESPHLHHFLRAEALRALAAGSEVEVEVQRDRVRLSTAIHPSPEEPT
jgi:hypothetical protein